VKSQRQKQRMTEKKAKTATSHLRETPEQRQQTEHEDAIEDAGKDGKRVGAGFEKRMAASRSSKFGIFLTRSAPHRPTMPPRHRSTAQGGRGVQDVSILRRAFDSQLRELAAMCHTLQQREDTGTQNQLHIDWLA
jgi:hypothetical protein